MKNRLGIYARFVKIEHSVFALPLILAGALLGGRPSIMMIGWIILAGVAARTVAFALNRILDRHIDKKNPRTQDREIPSGAMTVAEGVAVGAVATAIYLYAAWRIAPICLAWSPLPLVVFVVYPLLKRVTPWAHLGVGVADAFAPLGGWLAVTQTLDSVLEPILLLAAFACAWVAGFDVIYATLDETFDRANGVHSLPADWGRPRARVVSAVFHSAAFVCLAVLYATYFRTPFSGLLLAVIGVLLAIEQRASANVDLAFFKINGIISFLVLGFVWAGVTNR